MGTNTTQDTRFADMALSWGIAILGGVLACVMLLMFADIGITGAVFLAGLMVAIGGFFVTRELTRPLPRPGGMAKPKPAAPAAARTAAPKAPAAPAARASVPAAESGGAGAKPATLSAPREGGADDLKAIKGIGPKLEEMLHGMGYYHYEQIATWTEAEIAWVDENLEGFKGRVTRDDWVLQARDLARD